MVLPQAQFGREIQSGQGSGSHLSSKLIAPYPSIIIPTVHVSGYILSILAVHYLCRRESPMTVVARSWDRTHILASSALSSLGHCPMANMYPAVAIGCLRSPYQFLRGQSSSTTSSTTSLSPSWEAPHRPVPATPGAPRRPDNERRPPARCLHVALRRELLRPSAPSGRDGVPHREGPPHSHSHSHPLGPAQVQVQVPATQDVPSGRHARHMHLVLELKYSNASLRRGGARLQVRCLAPPHNTALDDGQHDAGNSQGSATLGTRKDALFTAVHGSFHFTQIVDVDPRADRVDESFIHALNECSVAVNDVRDGAAPRGPVSPPMEWPGPDLPRIKGKWQEREMGSPIALQENEREVYIRAVGLLDSDCLGLPPKVQGWLHRSGHGHPPPTLRIHLVVGEGSITPAYSRFSNA
ncbi:hypothetical protein LXA43DRAFT_1060981 [Ganoderma leucocontextum]|nr:hypothetical protein LXA43DRAFT_1060981 [Ganoderma leucocontextum]